MHPPHRNASQVPCDPFGMASSALPVRIVDKPNTIRYHAGTMIDKELVAATSASITLTILSEADGYGYEIIQRVTELSRGELEWTEAMLYPVLHRLEDRELVKSYWQTSSSGRKRKYYSITSAGRAELKEKKRQWRIVDGVLGALWNRAD